MISSLVLVFCITFILILNKVDAASLKVKLTDNTDIQVEVEDSDTIQSIKEKIQGDSSLEEDDFYLTFNGVILDEERTLQYYNILPNGTVEVKMNEYVVMVLTDDLGTITNIKESYRRGDEVKITAVPNEGYVFQKWFSKDIEITNPTNATLTLTMPKDNLCIEAIFIPVSKLK